MNITYVQFAKAASAAGLAPDVAERFWAEMEAESASATTIEKAAFSGVNLSYYGGGVLLMLAGTFLLSECWSSFGAGPTCVAMILYAAALWILGEKLFRHSTTRRPGGVLVTAAVCMTPLIVYTFQCATRLGTQPILGSYHSFYEVIAGRWIWMELATIAVGVATFRVVRFPFVTLPIAFTLWFLSLDLSSAIATGSPALQERTLRIVTALFGSAMLFTAYKIDRRTREDFGFWLYLYGTLALNAATIGFGNSELTLFGFAIVYLCEIIFAIVVRRRVLLIFGGLGFFGYLSHLAFNVFAEAIGFPITLSLLGIGLIYAGISYQRHSTAIRAYLVSRLPILTPGPIDPD